MLLHDNTVMERFKRLTSLVVVFDYAVWSEPEKFKDFYI